MNLLNIPFTKLSPDDISRPWLPVTIINSHTNKSVKVLGLIDTGADECALPASYAGLLGHNLLLGASKEINTGNGKTIAYSHTIKIEIADFVSQDTLIDFMPNLYVPLLGTKSFLSNFILTINYPKLIFSLEKSEPSQ
jgi:predicted aspartyl protease